MLLSERIFHKYDVRIVNLINIKSIVLKDVFGGGVGGVVDVERWREMV